MDTTGQTAPEDFGLSSVQLGRVKSWAQALVDTGKLAGVTTMVARRGRTVHLHSTGLANKETGLAMAPDTIVRIYSMTKPLTSVAVMMLYEQGLFQVDDPVSRFLPCFTTMRVAAGGQRGKIDTVPAARPITIRDLLTHTSGLTYGFMQSTLVDALYRDEASISKPPNAPWANWSNARRPSPCSPSPAPNGTTASRPTCWATWSPPWRVNRSGSSCNAG